MSQEVKFDSPLTQDERAYLEMRGRQADIDRVDNAFGTDEEDRVSGREPTGDGPQVRPLAWGETLVQRRARLEEELRALDEAEQSQQEAAADGGGDVEGSEDQPYAEWKVPELQKELRARGLPASGSKPEMVQRLEADDEQSQSQE